MVADDNFWAVFTAESKGMRRVTHREVGSAIATLRNK
jgi:hypothetical protein